MDTRLLSAISNNEDISTVIDAMSKLQGTEAIATAALVAKNGALYDAVVATLTLNAASSSTKEAEDICRWIFEWSSRPEIDLQRVSLSFLPPLLYTYLVSQNKMRPAAGVEAALMSFYNKSITREQEKFRPPSLSSSSLYHNKEDAAAAIASTPAVITATALKNLSSESAVTTSSNVISLKQVTDVNGSNIDSIVGISIRRYGEELPHIASSLPHLCYCIMGILTKEGPHISPGDRRYAAQDTAINVSSAVLVEALSCLSFGVTNEAVPKEVKEACEVAVKCIHRKSLSLLDPLLLLAATALLAQIQ